MANNGVYGNTFHTCGYSFYSSILNASTHVGIVFTVSCVVLEHLSPLRVSVSIGQVTVELVLRGMRLCPSCGGKDGVRTDQTIKRTKIKLAHFL